MLTDLDSLTICLVKDGYDLLLVLWTKTTKVQELKLLLQKKN